jgi:hypothetical protein
MCWTSSSARRRVTTGNLVRRRRWPVLHARLDAGGQRLCRISRHAVIRDRSRLLVTFEENRGKSRLRPEAPLMIIYGPRDMIIYGRAT